MDFNEKSRGVSFILTLIFGPLGLLYTSVGWGLMLLIIAVLTSVTAVGPAICWILAIAIGDHKAHKHNEGLKKLYGALAARGQAPQ